MVREYFRNFISEIQWELYVRRAVQFTAFNILVFSFFLKHSVGLYSIVVTCLAAFFAPHLGLLCF